MLDERFVIVGVIVNFMMAMGYLKSTLEGKTKPNKVTWFLWALAPMIAVSAELKQGVGLLVLPTFISGFNPALIFLGSFLNKKSQWKIGKLDIICAALSITGLIFWKLTQIPNIAILFAIIADIFAGIPTLLKSYKYPETENSIAFSGGAFSSLIGLLTIKTWAFAYYAFPAYLFTICITLILLIKFKLGLKIQKVFA